MRRDKVFYLPAKLFQRAHRASTTLAPKSFWACADSWQRAHRFEDSMRNADTYCTAEANARTGRESNGVTYDDFLALDLESAGALPPALAALAFDRAENWEAAHERAAKVETLAANRIHAYLHRKEGDLTNARYWYRRVGEPMPDTSLDAEWTTLVHRFLVEL